MIERYRNPKYLEWVRTLPCACCKERTGDVEAHHIKGVGHLSGVGLTAPDCWTMPLCRACHDRMQRDHEMWPDQFEYVARTICQAIEAGLFKFTPNGRVYAAA